MDRPLTAQPASARHAALARLAPALVAIVLGVAGGMGLRALLDPWLGAASTFTFALPACAIVAAVAGLVPGLVTALLSALWALTPVVPPVLAADDALLQVTLFLVAAGTLAWIGSRMRPGGLDAVAGPAPAAWGEGAMQWLRLAIVAAALLPTLTFAAVAYNGYRNAFAEARGRVERAARVAEQHASRVIETNEVIARQIVQALESLDDAQIRAHEPALHARLRAMVAELPQIQSVWVWDASGKPLLSNRFQPPPPGLNVSDRAYFQWAREHREGWYVSEPLVSRATGERFVDLTRRRSGPDGGFAGVISVSLYPAYFTQFYAGLAADDPGLTLTLIRTDGKVVARWPELNGPHPPLRPDGALARAIGSDVTSAPVDGMSSFDGQMRYGALRRLERHPLYVLASLDRNTVLAAWQRQTITLAAFTFPIALGLVFAAGLALRITRREMAALARLRAESDQRRRAEEALRQAQKLEALGQLTGGVAHDFNNLLMVVHNSLFVLTRLQPVTAASAQVAAIFRAVDSGAKLTRQLLAFSRRQALRPEVIDLAHALPQMLELMRTTVGRAVDCRAQVADGTALLEVDRAELELALINLAINARDAMEQGGRLLVLATNATAEEAAALEGRPGVMIRVSDSGSGVAPEVLDRVFEPFFTTKAPGRGTGLGLSQVYGFCAQAGGTVRITSTPAVGTTVAMLLPATDKMPPPATLDDTGQARLAGHLLLVEDNLEVAAATVPVLEGTGCTVTHAASGTLALALLRAAPDRFDAVLSDIVMPGDLNGLELALQIRAEWPHLPVLLMSGFAAELHRAVAAGFELLAKPVAPAALAEALARALARAGTRHATPTASS